MRRTTAWTIAVVCILGIVGGPVVVRGAFRYYEVQKTLSKIPYAEERLAVIPKIRTLTASEPIKPVDLGYATFDMGTTGSIYIATEGDSGIVIITNADFGLRITTPFPIGGLTNLVAVRIEVEETQSLPISRIALMSRDAFHVYLIKLVSKVGNNWGSNEIYSFATSHIKGIVNVGEGPDDRQRAMVSLSSLDGTRDLGMQVFLLPGSSKDIALALDPILASFQFTVDKVSDRDEIKKLISQAGIPKRPTK
jgi:hypothetical protein